MSIKYHLLTFQQVILVRCSTFTRVTAEWSDAAIAGLMVIQTLESPPIFCSCSAASVCVR